MEKEKKISGFSILVSDSFDRTDDRNAYEVSFRRWLVRQIEGNEMSIKDAIKKFNFHPKNGRSLIFDWCKKYADETIPPVEMTEQEKQKLTALQKQVKEMEKQLADARMRNIALDTLIDVAEEKLKISIRKKPGAKQ